MRNLLWFIYRKLYYDMPYPGASRGRYLDGVRDFAWDMLCGWDVRASLNLSNIYWRSGVIALIVSAIPIKSYDRRYERKDLGKREWRWVWRRERKPKPFR